MTEYKKHKKKLEEEKELLLNELKKIGAVKSTSGVKDDYEATEFDKEKDVNDLGDTAKNINNLIRRDMIVTELEQRLRNVDDAMERINNNEYGFCKECKEPIEEKRLEANPAADTCIKHMEV